jgi:hypothetical protein
MCCNDCRSHLSEFKYSLIASLQGPLVPRRLRAHGSRRPTAETSRHYSLLAQCGHRSVESCEGPLQHHTGQACFRNLQRHSHNGQGGSLSALSVLIDRKLIEYVQESMTNEEDYVELALACADVCTALKRGLDGKLPKDLGDSVYTAINQLTR